MVKDMYITINNKEYEVVVTKKSIKNTYLRVKEDMKIYVTTSYLTPNFMIKKFISNNENFIKKQINRQEIKKEKSNNIYFLGNEINIIKINTIKKPYLENNTLYVKDDNDIEKWFKKQTKIIFKERLDYNYSIFTRKIPYPKLYIRKMSTRWGVCNVKLIKVTLNSELIHKDINCLDYVIIHELSHLIHKNHSKEFWKLVEENKLDYKIIRKEMRE